MLAGGQQPSAPVRIAGPLTAAEQVTWERAGRLLGDRHGFSQEDVAAALRLADGLDLVGQGDEARFAWLAGQVGLERERRRLFGLLVLAVSVFGAGGADVAGLADLRRLADAARRLRRADRGEAVTEGELAGVFRRVWWWPGNEPVTAEPPA